MSTQEFYGLILSSAALIVALLGLGLALDILTLGDLQTIALVAGVILLISVIWCGWVLMDHKTYENWKRKVERQ
jgi:ABC-type nickel/cobalt efflux system permease component RcnA